MTTTLAPGFPAFYLHHFSIAVPDMERAIAFWQEAFGFVLLLSKDVPPLQGRVAFLDKDGVRLELWCLQQACAVPLERQQPNTDLLTCGAKHVAFAVQDVHAALAHLHHKGVTIVSVQRSFDRPMMAEEDPLLLEGRQPPVAAFVSDPFGTLIEIIQAH